MISTKRKLWKWGPIESKPVYPDSWFEGMVKNGEKYKPGWPVSLTFFFKKNAFLLPIKQIYMKMEEKYFPNLFSKIVYSEKT